MIEKIIHKVEWKDINDIQENENNPRRISRTNIEHAIQSLKDAPWMFPLRPIIVSASIIIGGNQRYRAAKELGYDQVPVMWTDDLTESEIDEFIIKDNLSYGEWKLEMIKANYSIADLKRFGFKTPHKWNSKIKQLSAPKSDKSPFIQRRFTFSAEQARDIQEILDAIKSSEGYKECEFDNKNDNGNALWYALKLIEGN